jgi:protein DGCR14
MSGIHLPPAGLEFSAYQLSPQPRQASKIDLIVDLHLLSSRHCFFLLSRFGDADADSVGMDSSKSLVHRGSDDLALMPPPPVKRIKRPAKVLDEDDYTDALSDIIARDYFPGLRETQAQQEYLTALDSNDEAWIAEAGQKLRDATAPARVAQRRTSRGSAFDSPRNASKVQETPIRAMDTPRSFDGSQTPISAEAWETQSTADATAEPKLDTTNMSLSSFQSKYTSEDNESFNTILDKQNQKRREAHAYLWTEDQRIPSARQLTHCATEARLLKDDEAKASAAAKDRKALIPMSTGATANRPARPDAWKITKPDNNFMFFPQSIDEDCLPTAQELREAASKAGPKQVIHENTRFPPLQYHDDAGPIPPSPSLNTDIIARRDAARADMDSVTDYPGGETPRVNGYAFVDEDEPSTQSPQESGPSYRDLLAGQVGDSTPNPFKISSMRKREDLHHRMVEDVARKKRERERETVKGPGSAVTPSRNAGNMTPAARKLMERLGRTPVNVPEKRMGAAEMWTPVGTPRRKVVK